MLVPLGVGLCVVRRHTTPPSPPHTLDREYPICELEALNTAMAIKLWPNLAVRKVRLYSNSSTAIAIIQAGKGRNRHIQECAREI